MLLFGPTPDAMRRHQADLDEWHAVCDDMAAAEQRALEVYAPGPCELCQYWGQQCIGLTLEVPLRLCYHTCCMTGAFVFCLNSPPAPPSLACDPERAVWSHHAYSIQEYWWLARLLVENLCVRPCSPWYVYNAEVGLVRPPRPTPPVGCCDQFRGGLSRCCCCGQPSSAKQECCDVDCQCERILFHVNRRLRAMLCTYAGVGACSLATCAGPCPCCVAATSHSYDASVDPDEKKQSDDEAAEATAAPRGELCCFACLIETAAERHRRFDDEYEEARQARTAKFYERRNAVARGEPVASSDEALYAEFVPTGERPTAEPTEADTHMCERVQGRLAAAALFGCCCLSCYGVATGIGAVLHPGVAAAAIVP